MAKKIYTPIEHTEYFKGSDDCYYTQVDNKYTKVGIKSVPKEIISQEHRNSLCATELEDCIKRHDSGRVSSDPTWSFEVGEEVVYGAHKNCFIVEVLPSNIYKTLIRNYRDKANNETVICDRYNYHNWVDLRKMSSIGHESNFKPDMDKQLRITYFNHSLDSLIHKVYHSGVNFEPDYQRGLVWTNEQKVALIDSIFRNIDIGKFTFINMKFGNELWYEILDGKQRLTAIREFYENRFTYKGKTFDQLSGADKNWFNNFPAVSGETQEPDDRKQIYEYFCRLNTGGEPMDPKHLEKIKEMAK